MTKKIRFQYSVLRYFHDLATEEFINVGLVVFSRSENYFNIRVLNRYRRITQAFPGAEGDYFRRYVEKLRISLHSLGEDIEADPQRLIKTTYNDDIEHLLIRVLPKDDSAIQFSKARFGSAENLDKVFEQLYKKLIIRYFAPEDRASREDEDVWQVFQQPLKERNLLPMLTVRKVKTKVEEFTFNHSWKNGAWNVLKPISFDLQNPGNVRLKARSWLGAAHILDESEELSKLYFLLGRPIDKGKLVEKAYEDAVNILDDKLDRMKVEIVAEENAEEFAQEIKDSLHK